MKFLFKKTAIAFACLAILLAACKNPAQDIEINVNTDILKSPMLIQFVNAKSGSEGPKEFNVEIKGPNANLVRTPTGGRVFKASAGLLNLMLDRAANPTPSNPVKFTITATAAGFAPTFQHVEITSATNPSIYKVAMVEYANPSVGNGTLLATKAITNGTASSELTFTTNTNADLAQKANITIAQGTGFLDAAGQAIAGTQLEARVVYSGTSTNGMSPMPAGGNLSKNIIGANGQPITGEMFLHFAGVVAIDMFVGTKEVKSFTKPVTVDMEVNSNMINPNTKQPIQENETMPMWSLNQATGQWKNEGTAKLVKNTAGKLVARMQITHLSLWSPFYIEPPANVEPIGLGCIMSVTINRPTAEDSQTFTVKGSFLEESVTFGIGEKTKSISLAILSKSSARVTVSPGFIASFGIKPKYGTLRSETISNPCGQQVTLSYPPPPDATVNVDMDLQFKCKNKELRTGINAMITVSPQGASSDEAIVYTLVNGKASGSLVIGTTYTITVAIDGKSYTTTFTPKKQNIPLPSSPDLQGSVNYDEATNTLKIVGEVGKICN